MVGFFFFLSQVSVFLLTFRLSFLYSVDYFTDCSVLHCATCLYFLPIFLSRLNFQDCITVSAPRLSFCPVSFLSCPFLYYSHYTCLASLYSRSVYLSCFFPFLFCLFCSIRFSSFVMSFISLFLLLFSLYVSVLYLASQYTCACVYPHILLCHWFIRHLGICPVSFIPLFSFYVSLSSGASPNLPALQLSFVFFPASILPLSVSRLYPPHIFVYLVSTHALFACLIPFFIYAIFILPSFTNLLCSYYSIALHICLYCLSCSHSVCSVCILYLSACTVNSSLYLPCLYSIFYLPILSLCFLYT
jgi:hypothetical protein